MRNLRFHSSRNGHEEHTLILDINQIARVAHEANRAYCATIGDTTHAPWEHAPEWQKRSALGGVKLHLDSLAQGQTVPPQDAHAAWMMDRKAQGWLFGPVKDPEKKTHPLLRPYNQLPVEEQLKDYLFGAVVSAFYRAYHDAAGPSAAPPTATSTSTSTSS